MNDASKPQVGTGGDDILEGSVDADRLIGAAGDDLLQGLAGNDVLWAGTGNDVLEGGAGADELTGGRGGDVFAYAIDQVIVTFPQEGESLLSLDWGHDVVTDFEVGVDRLRVTDAQGHVMTAQEASQYLLVTEVDVDQDGALDTVLRIDYTDAASGIHYTDPGSSITLLGVSGASVDSLFGGA